MNPNHGFTLIELSIVLVIIGLIVGGILVGQDLIKAAEIRAQISQFEKYNTTANAFRDKYRYLPGDIPPALTQRLGFFTETTLGGTYAHQDGDWRIGGQNIVFLLGEHLSFWRHLTDAQMIDGNFGTAASGTALDATTGGLTGSTLPPGRIKEVLPPSKLGRGSFVIVHSHAEDDMPINNFNWLQLTGFVQFETNGDLEDNMLNVLSPIEVSSIDQKMDDGFPRRGKVIATKADDEAGSMAPTAPGACAAVDETYNLAIADSLVCGVMARFN